MDTVALIGRVLVSLAAVLGVMWVIARRMRGSTKKRGTRLLEVLDRQQLSRNATVAVIRIGDQALVVGVTDNQVNVLGDTDLAAAQAVLAENEGSRRPAGARRAPTASRTVRVQKETPAPAVPTDAPARANALAGSALSPATWKQTIESLRDLTSRTD
jgi:flagellar protein FliO/FliZ